MGMILLIGSINIIFIPIKSNTARSQFLLELIVSMGHSLLHRTFFYFFQKYDLGRYRRYSKV